MVSESSEEGINLEISSSKLIREAQYPINTNRKKTTEKNRAFLFLR